MSDKPTIVHEVTQMDRGGIEEVVRCIIKESKRYQHSVVTYKDGPMKKILEEAGAKVVICDEKSEDVKADLVHLHTGGGDSNFGRQVRQVNAEMPIVETIHSPVKSPIPRTIVDEKVGVSQLVARINNGICIYNGIDVDRIKPSIDDDKISELITELHIGDHQFVVGRCGRLGYDKGCEDWLLVIAELQILYPGRIAPLIVGGEATNAPGYMGRLRNMADSLPLEKVLWVGDQERPGPWYELMDCFLYPSRSEGFGLVFAEAMANGVPIVTCNNEVNTEVVGGSGMLVGHEIAEYVNAVKTLIEEASTLIPAYGQHGIEMVEEYFTAERMSYEYEELYARLLRSKNGSDNGKHHEPDIGQDNVPNTRREDATPNGDASESAREEVGAET